ncbi:hypothetical protein CCPUN_08590 [Cardinium endosymbiont of Culicoides punctatus]|nr:hypothetical protein CCPUN_08590 [Cardinium endosymbiont of Culicoides punctatus]
MKLVTITTKISIIQYFAKVLTIMNPTKVIPGKYPGTFVYFKDNLQVIANENGDVVTVFWK